MEYDKSITSKSFFCVESRFMNVDQSRLCMRENRLKGSSVLHAYFACILTLSYIHQALDMIRSNRLRIWNRAFFYVRKTYALYVGLVNNQGSDDIAWTRKRKNTIVLGCWHINKRSSNINYRINRTLQASALPLTRLAEFFEQRRIH